MNWQDITVSNENNEFLLNGKSIFNKKYIEVLKFHSPGIAPVKDNSGSYHIDITGKELYPERYTRTFGYYCKRAAVVLDDQWFHLNESGERAYNDSYTWTGNFQENLCTVRDNNNFYYHINLDGKKIYSEKYIYSGDFKDGIACVKTSTGKFKHIDRNGKLINDKAFLDLGVFHKGYATAKDERGWFHIDKLGNPIYNERYLMVEPFYNGFALVTNYDNSKVIIDEKGENILNLN
ncbi:MAG: WG repeat-containing protein [Bacteroidia bacterium]|nr:WG repeat-containing protein [Bacteroidia bacterium]